MIADKAKDFIGRVWVADEVADWIANGTERFFAITGAPAPGSQRSLDGWRGPVRHRRRRVTSRR